jgi:hypothetical protein
MTVHLLGSSHTLVEHDACNCYVTHITMVLMCFKVLDA